MGKRIRIGLLLLVLLLTTIAPPAAAAPYPTLFWGSRGSYVRLAQRKLSAWGYYHGPVDGRFEAETHNAVVYFQRKNGLAVDGYVGPEMWRALGENPAGAPAPRVATTNTSRSGNLWLLARVIGGEARGESFEGQVAVGAVILNRVRDPRFPHTIAGVIYQPDAFESVTNGSIWHALTPSSVQAAKDALNGWDPTGGAVYFWNPATAHSPWVWSRPIITQIGKHVFAR